MCTITLINHTSNSSEFILTSNRDEATGRNTFLPDYETYADVQLFFPKDAEAGGSWIGVSELNRIACLMNGAEEAHQRKSSYRLSRGVVLKDFLSSNDLDESIKNYNFKGIEPFTMILVDFSVEFNAFEMIWNEEKFKVKILEPGKYIWSSSPLYDANMRKLRQDWFAKLQKNRALTPQVMWNFHHNGGIGDKNLDLIIDRGFLKTKSISQFICSENLKKFKYDSLETGEYAEEELQFNA